MTLTLQEVEGYPGPVFLSLEDAQAFRDTHPPIGQARVGHRECVVGNLYTIGQGFAGHSLSPTNTVVWYG